VDCKHAANFNKVGEGCGRGADRVLFSVDVRDHFVEGVEAQIRHRISSGLAQSAKGASIRKLIYSARLALCD
jgi:hypothetical protein